MTLSRLVSRNLAYYWRTNLAVLAGVGAAVAVFSGAMLVGESVRSSLRDLILERLGSADYALSADRMFREDLANRIASNPEFQRDFKAVCPIVLLQGALIHEKSGLRAHDVNVYGVDERFWTFHDRPHLKAPEGREALVGEPLARETSAQVGDTLLLRIEKQEAVPGESLFGRRDDVGRTLRLTCREILPSGQLSEFSLRPGQGSVFSMYVPLKRIQADLQQTEGANTLLISARDMNDRSGVLREILRATFALEDLGIKVRVLRDRNVISVESKRILLEEGLVQAVEQASAALRLRSFGIYTYLANSIRARGRSIPYSTITAANLFRGGANRIKVIEGNAAGSAAMDAAVPIWLNEWARHDLGASVGDTITIDYYLWLEHGQLAEKSAQFRLAGVFALEGSAADPDLAPEVPGISNAGSLSDWNPPFPLDLTRIRPKDEDYWDHYRTTPKAFITLEKGQELWRTRFGALSSIRLQAEGGSPIVAGLQAFEKVLRAHLDPERSGFALRFAKGAGLEAARGSTDFGEYFLYFSFFIISAAILLAALFFRLGLEQRIKEIGLLQASGFPIRLIRSFFLLEAGLLSLLGSLIGVCGSVAYAGLIMFGLRTWWQGAVGTRSLELHVSSAPLLAGSLIGSVAAALSVALTLKGLQQNSPRAMLSGVLEVPSAKKERARRTRIVAFLALTMGALLLLGASAGLIGTVAGFFGAGASLLAAALGFIAHEFRRERKSVIAGRGWPALFRLGLRNAAYRPGRSLLCVALISSATFVIASLEAFRYDPARASSGRHFGAGGYALLAESVLPLLHDLNSIQGKEAHNLSPREIGALQGVVFSRFRLRPGDDASCLNLYAPGEPRILGASQEFVRSGRFAFEDSLARTPEEKSNPWLLLEHRDQQASAPAIGDANTIRYILHKKLGDELIVRGSRGESIRLRLVAALRDSIFQSELLISEAGFLRLFPEPQGYRFFLIDVPQERSAEVARVLEEGLSDYGFDAGATGDRLAAYHRVENTYLSTFQSLGGLGLILGTVGLAAVLLRNVLERRHELALLQAVGYRKTDLAGMVIAENGMLLVLGLAAGTGSALLAIGPAWASRGHSFPLFTLALTLGAVVGAGLASSLLAVSTAFRSPLLSALRSE